MPQGRGGAKPPPPERSATQRMVLSRVRVMVVPEGADEDSVAHALGRAGITPGEITDAWVECGSQPGDKAKQAIDAFVKPGTEGQMTGVFRAVPLASWRGGVRYTQPSLVPVKAEQLD